MGQLQVPVDQVGYEAHAQKQAFVLGTEQDHRQQFSLIDAVTRSTVLTGKLIPNGWVDTWGDRAFWIADFSSWQKDGHYAIETQSATGEVISCSFDIANNLLERRTLSNVIFYFKGQRASGLIDRADRHLPLPADQHGLVDAHGGWYDATATTASRSSCRCGMGAIEKLPGARGPARRQLQRVRAADAG